MLCRFWAVGLLILLIFPLVACTDQDEDNELVIMTHDSFDIGQEVIKEFETDNSNYNLVNLN